MAAAYDPLPLHPQIFPAERDFGFWDDGNYGIRGYLRRAGEEHRFAYTKFAGMALFPDRRGRRTILQGCQYVREGEGRYRAINHIFIKKVSKNWIRNNPWSSENVMNEIIVAQQLGDDRRVVSMTEVLEDNRYYYIIMPKLGSDINVTMRAHPIPDMARLDMPGFTRPMVENLIFTKDNDIIHRDISPENAIVLLDQSRGHACPLIDFAMALRCRRIQGIAQLVAPQHPCGKFGYMSPEVYFRDRLGFGVDVWAVGCILFLLWTDRRLYRHPSDRCFDFFINHDNIRLAPIRNLDDFLIEPDVPPDYVRVAEILGLVKSLTDVQRDLLSKMLKLEPSERITAEAVLEHPYFQQR
jgi:cyclin-dependent kinase 2